MNEYELTEEDRAELIKARERRSASKRIPWAEAKARIDAEETEPEN